MRSSYGWTLVASGLLIACGGDDDWPSGHTDSTSNGGGAGSGTGGSAPTATAAGGSSGGGSGGVANGGSANGGATSTSGGSAGASGGSGGAGANGGLAGSSGAGGAAPDDPLPVPGTEGFNCDPPVGKVPPLRTVTVAEGFTRPLFVTFAPGDPTRLFVVEQDGVIRVIDDGTLVEEPFLDLANNVEIQGNEQGLLGVAFHPDYADNGRFYVNYTAHSRVPRVPPNTTIVAEYTVSNDPNVAEPDSERVLLTQEQPARNHNGGMIAFGPDGFLYIGMGDGGGANDPDNNGQTLSVWLGKMLRIDVDASDAGEYGIPDGNMATPALPEIFHYGLRNPWRYSFDGCRGDLYLADVGQNDWEELNVVPHGAGNLNFGWKVCEGLHVRGSGAACDNEEFTAPILDYGRDVGNSITGGYVYRGSLVPSLRGTYFYADYSSQSFFAFRYVDGVMMNARELTDELDTSDGGITSFGQDYAGEVYVVRRNGLIQRIEAAP